ncbi:MAG TPA: hypothetical protein VEB21_03425 [Terriglobales bacterium]|nr:hypothetical protein [Terriglobales bacterium]
MRHWISSAKSAPAAAPSLAALALIAAAIGASGCVRLGMYDLHPAAAYWVDNSESNAPHTGEFDFNSVSISPDGAAWIAGDKFILRAHGDQLEVTFANLGSHRVQTLRSIAARGDAVWVGGSRSWERSKAVVWRRQAGGEWTPALAGLETDDRTVYDLDFSPGGEGVAVLFHHANAASELAVFDGAQWRPIAVPHHPRKGAHVCQRDDGATFLGLVASPEAAIYRLVDSAWVAEALPLALPAAAEGELIVPRLSCFADGTVLASVALRRGSDVDPERWWLFRRQGDSWQEVPFPAEYHRGGAFITGGVGSDDFWVAGSCAGCDPSLLHFTAGQWHSVEPPALPGGRRRGYLLKEIAFHSANDGWAIGDEVVGPNLNRGVIFHYRDGVWSYRPWNWRFWNQPLWGLLGD